MNIYIEFTYLAASILFVFGLKGLTHPDSARRGMLCAAAGMAAAIIGTLFNPDIVTYQWIIIGLIIGGGIGAAMSIWMPMTAMPERTALSHAFGALAAALVGITGRGLVEILCEIATAETPQRMFTPQDRQEELLVRAAKRIEGPTFTPRKGGAVTNAI